MEDLKLVDGEIQWKNLSTVLHRKLSPCLFPHIFSIFLCFLLLDFTFPLFLSLLSLRSFLFSVHYSTCSLYYLLSSPFTRFTFISILSFFSTLLLFPIFPLPFFISFSIFPLLFVFFSSCSFLSPPTILNPKLFSK